MSAPLPSRLRRTVVLLGLVPAALGLAACGNRGAHPTVADSEAQYVQAGPLTYQVQISRQLNPYATEDRTYLAGVTAPAPKPDEEWFAVFLWAKNFGHHAATTTHSFDLVDTVGDKYYPVAINSQVNPFAWTSQTLQPNQQQPLPDSAAYYSATQGQELLFKVNDSVYSNRPLTLQIYAPGQSQPSSVSLDL